MKLENLIGLNHDDSHLRDYIDRIGERPHIFEMKEDDPTESIVLTFKKTGLQISFDKEKKINTIHVFSGRIPGYKAYSGLLPCKLSFHMCQEDAYKKLGQPTKSGGPVKEIIGDDMCFWDYWDKDKIVLHLQYTEDKKAIKMITIMSMDRVPKEELGDENRGRHV